MRSALLGGKTFRSLSEQKLSPREEKFERARQTAGFFVAPAIAILFALLPVNLEPDQHLLASVLLGVIVLWICEQVPIPVGGLIGVGAIVGTGILTLIGVGAEKAGPAVLLSFLIAGVVCACAALAMTLPAMKAAAAMRFKIMLVLPDGEPGRVRPRGGCGYLISRS